MRRKESNLIDYNDKIYFITLNSNFCDINQNLNNAFI